MKDGQFVDILVCWLLSRVHLDEWTNRQESATACGTKKRTAAGECTCDRHNEVFRVKNDCRRNAYVKSNSS